MEYIQPLQLQTWITQILAGSPEIFLALGMFFIFGMAGFFRMPVIGLFFMFGLFLLLFSAYITSPIIVLVAVIGGLVLGMTMANVFNR